MTGRASSPKPPPLPASSPWSGAQPQPPPEPPLGFEINRLTPHELEPSLVSSFPIDEAQAAPAPVMLRPALEPLLLKLDGVTAMVDRQPSAAASLFPNLKSGTPDVVERPRAANVADAMFRLQPRRGEKSPTVRSPESERLLRDLKELNATIDARLERERRP